MKFKFKAQACTNLYNAVAALIPVPVAIET